jgi:hypothetical protein
MATTGIAIQGNPTSFEEDASAVLHGVRGALTELLAAVGANPANPQDVARQLKLDRNLAWKVSKIVQNPDPFATFQHLPGSSGIEILLGALKTGGADEAMIEAARSAVGAVDRLIEVHTGDKATLELMLTSMSREGRQAREEQHRKLLYRGASYLWGVQAKVLLKAGFIAPNPDKPELFDWAAVSGLVGFRRLRADVSWVIGTRRYSKTDGTIESHQVLRAIDPVHDGLDQVPLMGEFCSKPLPQLRSVLAPDGNLNYEVVQGPVGNTAAINCVVGTFARQIGSLRRDDGGLSQEHLAAIDTPVEGLLFDIFLHRSIELAGSPEPTLHSRLHGPLGKDKRSGDLHMPEDVQGLGDGPPVVATSDFSEYSGVIRSVFERLEWDASEFRGYRLQMKYPPLATTVAIRYRADVEHSS